MEIDLYRDLTAFNALTADQQQAEAARLLASHGPTKQPARVVAAPAPVFVGPVVVDSPGSVILRAEDILPDDEPDPQPPSKPVETLGRKVKMDDQLKASGPLVDLNPTNGKPNGLVACPSCGSRSDGQDLFCIACGSFLNEDDEIEVEAEGSPVCVDCGAAVEPGEIFCPSCGSALPS